MLGLYVHIPFCRSKCSYCDFYSITDDSLKSEYTRAICKELKEASGTLPADTLYFGGGTPTLMEPQQISEIIKTASSVYGLENAEISIEANPNTVSEPLLLNLRKAGCNRISFGMQSADQHELQVLGRTHSPKDIVTAVQQAKSAGFENISVDIMLGTPYQNRASMHKTIEFISELDVQHVSAYLLKLEQNTPLYGSDITSNCPDEDACAEIYLSTVSQLEGLGFSQYEISNFSKPGYECRHNLKYWLCEPYLGFGCAAHSFTGSLRYGHSRDMKTYLLNGLNDRPHIDEHAGGWDEVLMLGLRLNRGVDLAKALKRFSFDKAALINKAEKYITAGMIEINRDTMRLTPKGFLISNAILSDLIS